VSCLGFNPLVSVLVSPAFKDGHNENLDIHEDTPILNVMTIVFDSGNHIANPTSLSTETVDLGPTSDAWLHTISRVQRWNNVFEVFIQLQRLVLRRKAPTRVMRGSSF